MSMDIKIIRKIIREVVDGELNISKEQIIKDLDFLNDFQSAKELPSKLIFIHNMEGNETIVTIEKNEQGWSIDYNIIGFLRDQKADFKLGPFLSYDEFIKTTSNQVDNNLLLSIKNSDDNKDRSSEKFIDDMIGELLSKREELMKLPIGQLDDVKKLCLIFDNALKEKTIEEIMPHLYSKNKNLTGIHNILNKVQSIGFYTSMNKGGMHSVEF